MNELTQEIEDIQLESEKMEANQDFFCLKNHKDKCKIYLYHQFDDSEDEEVHMYFKNFQKITESEDVYVQIFLITEKKLVNKFYINDLYVYNKPLSPWYQGCINKSSIKVMIKNLVDPEEIIGQIGNGQNFENDDFIIKFD